jgi:hypothetical protein
VPGDEAARFLDELRQLRSGAGLGQAELAARAHYPYDAIRAAEIGPAIPDLPVLSAYVRGCGGTIEEWEERWRSLTRSPSLPVPAARNAGHSAAASAGARIGLAAQDAESPDPSIIIAALNRVAEEMAGVAEAELPETPGVQPWSGPPPENPSATTAPATTAPATTTPAPAAAARPATAPAAPAPAWETAAEAGDESTAADRKPAGWDPIRVSSAWPALRPPPGDTDSSAGLSPAESADAWGSASPAKPAPWTSSARARPGAARSPKAAAAREAAPWEGTPWGSRQPGGQSSGTARADAGPAAGRPSGQPLPSSAAAGTMPVTGTGLPGRTAAEPPARASIARPPRAGVPSAGTSRTRGASGPGFASSRATAVVAAAVLLCVLAVLLAIFA